MSLWRNRDFTLLWGSQIVSTLGATITGTATPLLVLATTGSPLDAGLVGAAGTLPHLIANLPAGPLVDRWNRRRILLISEIVGAMTLLTIPVAIWFEALTTAQLCVVAFVQGLCFVFFGLAEDAALPMVVSPGELPAAIAHNEARGRAAALAGPPIGGALFGLDRALPFLLDGLSSIVAAGALLFLRRDLQKPPEGPAEPLWRSATTGIRYVWRNPLIRVSLLLIAVSNAVFQALVLVLVVLAGEQGATPSAVGLMMGVYSAGGLLGAIAAGRLHQRFSFRAVLVGINWIWAALLPLMLLTTHPFQVGVIGALCAFVGPLWNVVIFAYAGVVVPNELLGRVMSAGATVTWGVMPLASLAAGVLLTAVGPRGSLWALSGVMLAAAVAATVNPSVRTAPDRPAPTPVG
ncbi:MFS transporter [Actinoplanes derwentensis]|uniref:Predicted arabinose efflux permease, MFS family n=1 Tax=Actinoplanes derwentensis TaxID=113562 RepID=A0A1H2B3Z2_9ACTN|nr:MFS transporter [Actinoplanes derwentensis]GID87637.1 MFS transporter [Actinoplanes derwentensis]SDT52904.1 Predicted arabinose efflux permease, MFS family [Actinoplanes derwentensis]